MASSEVDQKFLGTFAKNIGTDNPLLSSMLFKVLGLSVLLSKQLVVARKLRKKDSTRSSTQALDLYFHVIWLSREGLRIVEQYIIPMVSTFSELKVLSHKIRASFYHVYALFHNQPSISRTPIPPKRPNTPPGLTSPRQARPDKGKAPVTGSPPEIGRIPDQPAQSLEGGPVGGISTTDIEPPPPTSADFLVPTQDFIPVALQSFNEASDLSEKLLWGSHPLRVSVKVEFAAFLYDCMHDHDASRNLAKAAIYEVYNAQEGMDDEMFADAAELVGVLGTMSKRGLGSSTSLGESTAGSARTVGPGSVAGAGSGLQPPSGTAPPQPAFPSPGMINPI